MTKIISDTLYHFVGYGHPHDDERNISVLEQILTSMTLRASHVRGQRGIITEVDTARAPIKGEPISQSVVCVCDIPFKHLEPHAAKYGRFGVGVCRSIFSQWGGRPVIYIPTSNRSYGVWGNRHRDEVMNVWQGLDDYFPEKLGHSQREAGSYASNAIEAVHLAKQLIARDYMAFMKIFDVDLPEHNHDNFYTEREWRKHSDLELAPCLRTVIAPEQHLHRFKNIIDSAEGRGFLVTGPVEFKSLPTA